MSLSLNILGMASRLLSRPTTSAIRSSASAVPRCTTTITSSSRLLSTTTRILAKPGNPKAAGAAKAMKAQSKGKGKSGKKGKGGKGGRGGGGDDKDPKLIQMMKHFAAQNPKNIPPPLRMARNRHLRHWTIHRGWLMFRRRQREARERVLMRQYQGMSAAMEELRLTSGPGTRDEGYLYRVAMEKKGVYGHKGIPIEYARAQTETPAKVAWNHEWKR